jgi:uncharacterized membrane protein YgaE (UPF0421/DUF939 family)
MKVSKLLSFKSSLFDSNRLVHSLKTAIAFLLGLFIVRAFAFPLEGQWVLISIVVVMCAQSRVGALMQKAYMRFLGTVLGAAIAALTLCLAYPNIVWVILILCLTTALFSYIADSPGYLREAGPLGAVTTVIILIGQNPSYANVLNRCFEISLGIAIALLVSRFIWPLHSRTQLRYIVRNTLYDLKGLVQQLSAFSSLEAEKNYAIVEEKIINRLVNQSKLYDEVIRESFGRSDLTWVFKDILHKEREIFRYINLMKDALRNFSEPVRSIFNQQPQVKKFYSLIQDLLQLLIKQMDRKNSSLSTLEDGLWDWKKEMYQELNVFINNASDKLSIDLFIFAAETLLVQLKAMNSLIKKI